MKVLVAGGTGFMGRHLVHSLTADSHQVWVLTRTPNKCVAGANMILWDGQSAQNWSEIMNEMDVVVNLSGLSLNSWPWTKDKKRRFHDSRVKPGLALVSAVEMASQRPDVFVQISGINYYGLQGETVADEETPAADDYLAQLTVAWEAATEPVESLGVRRVVCRSAVVLAQDAVLSHLLALPVQLFFGGPLGGGKQALPWIHIDDQIGAIRFLIDSRDTAGAHNLIAPQKTTNAEFNRIQAKVLRRPYWFPVPAFLLRLVLGEMSQLVLEGRFARPARLQEHGYEFRFPTLESALRNIHG